MNTKSIRMINYTNTGVTKIIFDTNGVHHNFNITIWLKAPQCRRNGVASTLMKLSLLYVLVHFNYISKVYSMNAFVY